ncbi:hypothetical protein H072_2455 [Dactylellina haptotyla CBS 200.50]|uniref:Attractin/MKLN-like beta-propeller domain-containing protein n=1 Tax=Dactylellina haptotyla (strain CBS 200.50) TaxID=1284197 RepID=S8C7B9_DACHA|nr:hypothetical protein H072_2455 [Dactylellina haptotyla CBS 200.50]
MLRSSVVNNVLALAATALLLVAPAVTQSTSKSPKLDPAENFCKRYQHQSAMTSKTLFIDGGTEWFHDDRLVWDGVITQGINTYLVTTNMSDSWDWKGNISQPVVYKTTEPGRKTGYVPSLNGGAIWPNKNETHLYFYGGTTNSSLSNFSLYSTPESDRQTLWKYNIADKFWDPVDYAPGSSDITRAAFGASVVAPELNKAYYLGGVIDRGSTDKSGDIQAPRFLDGLLEFDFETEAVRNISTTELGNRARAYSQIVYIPNYGISNSSAERKGILVSIGGEVKSSQIVDVSGTRRGDPVAMSDIAIFDIETEKWYVQQAAPHANQFPATRTDHCIVVKSSPDNTTQAIYMYGGVTWDSNRKAKYIDDVWILTLPSFRWIKIYEGEGPRYGHTCHVAPKGRQMITVGGLGQAYTADVNGSCDWETRSVGIYDLTTLQWGSAYLAHTDEYLLPVEVAQKINGTQMGEGTITAPLDGWSNPDIRSLFIEIAPPNEKKSNKGAIAGGIVGGVIGLGLIIAAVYYYYRRYIKQSDRPFIPPPEGQQWVKPELEGGFAPSPTTEEGPSIIYEIDDGKKVGPVEMDTKNREVPLEMP